MDCMDVGIRGGVDQSSQVVFITYGSVEEPEVCGFDCGEGEGEGERGRLALLTCSKRNEHNNGQRVRRGKKKQ